ncbi:MAG: DUF1593 domain-containing protein [Bacteroidetes bacterium]|nr:MAG: DUF1593 domain-containing protein [Bacteroidota bacterium]
MIQVSLILAVMQIAACRTNDQMQPNSEVMKPRIVVLTDVSSWETDDSESLVRLMVHADLFEIEGLIFTTGWSLEETRDDFFQLIHDAIDAYEKDLPNLMKRSGQTGFLEDESRQVIGYWPSPGYLRERTMFGSKKRGMDQIGEVNVSDGSNLITQQADEKDDRPVWVQIWGGGNTLAQAIWQVKQERTEAELKTFLHQIRAYSITDQDRSYEGGTPFEISSHQWMRREFEKDLVFLWDECAWKLQNETGRENWDEYALHIQDHGFLGKVYPKYKYGVEGDTPSFLHVMPNGLNDPLIPGQVGWAGYFEWGTGPDGVTSAYNNHEGKAFDTGSGYFRYFYPAIFNNFAARMDWAHEGKGNRNPEVVINGDPGIRPVEIEKEQGKKITLDASRSSDPDDDPLSFRWWVLPEAGTYDGDVAVPDANSARISFAVPSGSAGKSIHVICEVSDTGEPVLTGYRRIIIHSTE